MSEAKPIRLGEYLVSKKIVEQEQIDVALKEQNITHEKLGEILVRYGFCSRHDIIAALAKIKPIALVGEGNVSVDIPKNILLKNKTIILGDTGREIFISSLAKNIDEAKANIAEYAGEREIVLCPIGYNEIVSQLKELETTGIQNIDVTNEDDINKIIQHLVLFALENNASDIHIEPQERSLHIRNRIDGILRTSEVLPLEVANKLISRLKELAGTDVSEKMLPQDGSFTLSREGLLVSSSSGRKAQTIDFRLSTVKSAWGEKVTMRVLDKESVLLDIKELGISKIDDWLDLTRLTEGIIPVCGPTGSGKTTTLYSTIKHLKALKKAIYMIEEPIEYRIPFVTQVQVNRKIGLDFARFIRTILRHDPDIVIVGEIRDQETAQNAIRLADTGHLVYATMHTNDIVSTVTRLKDLGIDMSQLSFLLRGVLVQRLVRKVCKICKGEGCSSCLGGYKGRTLVTELVKLHDPDQVEALIERNLPYHTFENDARIKLESKITDCNEIERVLGKRVQGEWCDDCKQLCYNRR